MYLHAKGTLQHLALDANMKVRIAAGDLLEISTKVLVAKDV